MKKFVAMVGLMLITIVGAGVAQKSKGSGEAAARKTETQATPAVTNPSLTPVDDPGWTAGYLPAFDASGNLEDSYLNQLINTATVPSSIYLGFNTPVPQFNLHFTATADPAAITIDAYGHVGINFIGRRADGTQASPTAVVAGDNLFTLNGRGWFQSANPTVTPSGFSDTSRGNMKIFAAEPAGWTDTAEGTYITMATTQIGTINTTEKFRITDAGSVGIGTPTPGGALPSPLPAPVTLEVYGSVKLSSGSGGGFTFQDGLTQTVPAYNLAPANNTVTIAAPGTAAQTIAVNTAVIQPIVNGTTTCPAGSAVTSISPATGAVVCGAIGPGGMLASVPTIVATSNFVGGYGNGTLQTIYTATASGYYRVSVYMNVPTTGTCGTPPCAGEAIVVQWNDGISSTALTTSASCNLVTVCGATGSVPLLYLAAGQSITAQGQSNGTGAAPGGTPSYNAYVLVEQM